MTREFRGGLEGRGLKIAIVVASWNDFITDRLLTGALEGLHKHGVEEENITIARVPGSFEIPLTAKRMAQSGKYDAIIGLGAVLKGETAHFDHISSEATRGIGAVSRETGVPVLFGIITAYNVDQALERSGGKKGNRGYECALAAIQMANLLRSLDRGD